VFTIVADVGHPPEESREMGHQPPSD